MNLFSRKHLKGLLVGLTLASSAQAKFFEVNTLLDGIDAKVGDGICSTAAGTCSLRAAIQECNYAGGSNEIILPNGEVRLTITGDDDASAKGDLNPWGTLSISGQGANSTTIVGSVGQAIFRLPYQFTCNLSLDGLSISGGSGGNGGNILTQAGDGSLKLYR